MLCKKRLLVDIANHNLPPCYLKNLYRTVRAFEYTHAIKQMCLFLTNFPHLREGSDMTLDVGNMERVIALERKKSIFFLSGQSPQNCVPFSLHTIILAHV